MIRSLWRNLKSQRKMWMGPVSLVFKFERSVSIKGVEGQAADADGACAARGSAWAGF